MSSSGYGVQFAADCPDARVVHFDLICHGDSSFTSNRGGGQKTESRIRNPNSSHVVHPPSFSSAWLTSFDVTLHAPVVEFSGIGIKDTAANSNAILDPNETAAVFVGLLNRGTGPAESVRAILRSGDPRLTVVDSTGDYGTIRAGARQFNSANGFVLAAGGMVPQTQLPCTLLANGPRCRFTIPFTVTVGQLGPRDPQCDGPRTPPLYWAYDDVDTAYTEHPRYAWQELRGVGTHLAFLRDSNVVVDLPPEFGPFRYYGRRYTQITISNNGYIVPGMTTYINRENVALPTPGNPPMLAVDWDAMAPTLGGGVWYASDPADHRFIIEWDSVHYRQPSNLFDKFEIVLYDTTVAARDGNCEALFQYQTDNHMNLCTIGIEDPSESIGITASFNGRLATAASPIWPGRAIKFSSDPPFAAVRESNSGFILRPSALSLSAAPNPFRGQVEFRVPGSATVISHTTLAIYDVSGRLIRLLSFPLQERNPLLGQNQQSLFWDGRDSNGLTAEAGVYYCRLIAPTASPANAKLIKLD